MGSTTHASWLASSTFDGARYFDGAAPDLSLHCARAIRSAKSLFMVPPVDAEQLEALVWEGIQRFPRETTLYLRPMFWIQDGGIGVDPASTQFAVVLTVVPLADPAKGFTACLSSYRRPAADQAPTHAKASCLYPLATMAVMEAKSKGFDNGVLRDPLGAVADFAAQNIFIVRDGECITPAPNGTFLNGITKQRIIGLLREDGHQVVERTVRLEELALADEIFSTGNQEKLTPCLRYEQRVFEYGPVARRARELYWNWAHTTAREAPVLTA
jgi:branched-chain amino acid aminotransferase